jgi:hypothetical protein
LESGKGRGHLDKQAEYNITMDLKELYSLQENNYLEDLLIN